MNQTARQDEVVTLRQDSVLSAISAITGKIGSIEKRGKNSFHNYAYATAADILHKLQPMLAEHGLVIIPNQVAARFLDDGQALFAIDYQFALYHTDGTAHAEKPIITGMAAARNSKGGFDDKIANKCLTAATKYFLLTLFKIPTGDYDDADADDDRPAARTASNRLKKEGGDDVYKFIVEQVASATDVPSLQAVHKQYALVIAKWPHDWQASFESEIYEPRLAELQDAAKHKPRAKALSEEESAKVRETLMATLHMCQSIADITSWREEPTNVAAFKSLTKPDQRALADERDSRLADFFEREHVDAETGEVVE